MPTKGHRKEIRTRLLLYACYEELLRLADAV